MNYNRATNVQKIISDAQNQAEALIPFGKMQITNLDEFSEYLNEMLIRAYDSLTIGQLTGIMYSVVQFYEKLKNSVNSQLPVSNAVLEKLNTLVAFAKKKQRILQLNNQVAPPFNANQVTEFGIQTTKQSLLLLLEWTFYNITNLHPTFSQAKFLSTATNMNDNQLEMWFENMRLAIQLYDNPLSEIKAKIYEIDPSVCLQPYQNEYQDEPVLIQQLPCRVEYNGEANVDKYLLPDDDLEASFRGRALKGVKLQIGDGYKAVVLDDHVITKQKEILVYGHDFKPDRSTPSMN
ncbi:hypothetical protein HDV04_000078 [Boothiomyces sp. JEL0838]|nr:hypothetical protein HDV04_000078 [Boothiomyces sp. JEL0838]